MRLRRFVGICLDVQIHVFEYSKMGPYCVLLRHRLLDCRDPSQQPKAFPVAHFLECNVAHNPFADGRLYHITWHSGKNRPEQFNTYPL
jgi:hypothetical protein